MIYYASMDVLPERENPVHGSVEYALAHVFLRAPDASAARTVISRILADQYWRLAGSEFDIHAVSAEAFEGRDLGLKCYREAEEKGYSSAYLGVRATDPAIEFPLGEAISLAPNPGKFHNRQKSLSRRGRCLHYDAGEDCGSIIAAHSIQKSGMLTKIARAGQVYVLSAQVKDLAQSGGRLALRLRGVNQVSTFRGMCDKHDDQVFRPIDDRRFVHDPLQVALYAYRSLCREVFVKQNAVDQLEAMSAEIRHSKHQREIVGWMLNGSRLGNDQLQRHKEIYDESLRSEDVSDFRFRAYRALGGLPYAVSSVIFPAADFEGNYLQDLSVEGQRDAVTFATVRSDSEDILLLAWHASSDTVCTELLASLDRRIAAGAPIDDLISRFVLGSAENLALEPRWVEGLSAETREHLESFFSQNVDMTKDFSREMLQEGIEGLIDSRLELVAEHRS